MRTPERLLSLIDENIIESVACQLMSGKEAEVYVVMSDGEHRCAKVYKESNNRTFKHSTQYTEGRKVRSSRKSRAMESGSRYGRKERESEWQNTEVEALGLLAGAGVRVPKTYAYLDGVLILEMIADTHGNPAPRLNDVKLTKDQALAYHQVVIRQVVLMLCAGLIHGDLSEFNVLLAHDGPVIIDLPQAVQATANNAFRILERDINQLAAYFGRYAPTLLSTEYAKEIWNLYKNNKLRPDTVLTGQFQASGKKADVKAVLDVIGDARDDALERQRFKK